MDDEQNDVKDTGAEADAQDYKITLPLIALGLVVLPVFLALFMLSGLYLPIPSLVLIISPVVGIIVGIAALCRGKEHIGRVGMIVAFIAVTSPLALIALVFVIFIGAMTGQVSFM